MTKRIYHVRSALGQIGTAQHFLIRASNSAQALRHVTEKTFAVQVASQDDLVSLLQNGVKVEEVSQSDTSSPGESEHELPSAFDRRVPRGD